MSYHIKKNLCIFVAKLLLGVQVCSLLSGPGALHAGGDDLTSQVLQLISQNPKLQVATGLIAATGTLLAYEGATKVVDFFKPTRKELGQLILRKRMQRAFSPEISDLVSRENNRFVRDLPKNDDNVRIWQPKVLLQTLTTNNQLNNDLAASSGTIIEKYANQLPQNWTSRLGNLIGAGASESVGGGGASCGYHTIKNAALLLNAIYAGDDSRQMRDSIQMLQDSNYIKDLFGPSGKWRALIESKRKEQLLRYHLMDTKYANFLKTAQQIKDMKLDGYEGQLSLDEIRNLFEVAINDFDNDVMNAEVAEILASKQEVHIKHTPAEIIIELKEKYPNLSMTIGKLLIDKEFEATYVNSPIFFQALLDSHNAHCRDQGHLPFIFLGSDDLQGNELDLLIMQELENGMLQPFVGNFSYSIIEADDQIEDFVKKFHEDRKENDSVCHAIFLNGNAHWVALIINVFDDKTDYIIADSLNIPRYGQSFIEADEAEDQDFIVTINNSEIVSRINAIMDAINQ